MLYLVDITRTQAIPEDLQGRTHISTDLAAGEAFFMREQKTISRRKL